MACSSGGAGSCWGSLPYLLCGRQMYLYTVGHTNTHVSVYSIYTYSKGNVRTGVEERHIGQVKQHTSG